MELFFYNFDLQVTNNCLVYSVLMLIAFSRNSLNVLSLKWQNMKPIVVFLIGLDEVHQLIISLVSIRVLSDLFYLIKCMYEVLFEGKKNERVFRPLASSSALFCGMKI